ncbi:MAG: hypothetical protein WEC75_09850 [Dehalococcoidia bacterium]
MGLLKKDEKPAEAAATPLEAEAPPADEPGAPGEAAVAIDAAAEPEAQAAPDPLAAPAAPAPDALLDMFSSTQHEAEDRSLIMEMAGDVTMAELIDELQTAAAALGLVARRAPASAAEELAA